MIVAAGQAEMPVLREIKVTLNPPHAVRSYPLSPCTQHHSPLPPPNTPIPPNQSLRTPNLSLSPRSLTSPQKCQEKTYHRGQATPSHLHLSSHRQSPRHIAPSAAPYPPATLSSYISNIYTHNSDPETAAVSRHDTIKMPTEEENLQYLYLVLTAGGVPNVSYPSSRNGCVLLCWTRC
jgi:hypothetical protein